MGKRPGRRASSRRSRPERGRTQESRTQALAPPLSDLEACQRRWTALWSGTLELLEREAPEAHELLHRVLERYGLATRQIAWERSPGDRTVKLIWRTVPSLTTMIPTAETTARIDAFGADTAPVERRGRHAEAPLQAVVMLVPLLRQEYAGLPAAQRLGTTAARYMTRRLSELLGDREHASWLKLLRTARGRGLQVPFTGAVKPDLLPVVIRAIAATL
jgi:hypothetical protein